MAAKVFEVMELLNNVLTEDSLCKIAKAEEYIDSFLKNRDWVRDHVSHKGNLQFWKITGPSLSSDHAAANLERGELRSLHDRYHDAGWRYVVIDNIPVKIGNNKPGCIWELTVGRYIVR